MPETKGKCQHGEFDLKTGCPDCIQEERERREAESLGEEIPVEEQAGPGGPGANTYGAKPKPEKDITDQIVEASKVDHGVSESEPAAETVVALESQLREQINAVVEARGKVQEMADKKKSLYDEFQTMHCEFFGDVVTAATVVSEAEDKLRELTLKAYTETGNKAPAPGVGIREVTRLEYEPKEAFEWALEHRIALQLNKTAFDKLAKTAPETRPAFVKITTEPQATIAAELEKVE